MSGAQLGMEDFDTYRILEQRRYLPNPAVLSEPALLAHTTSLHNLGQKLYQTAEYACLKSVFAHV